MDGQQMHKNMVNITNHQGNENQNHNEGFPGGAEIGRASCRERV